MTTKRIFDKNTIMPFGKHKGLKIETILRDEPGYIVWMDENIDDIELAADIVDEALDNDIPNYDDSWGWDGDVQD